MRFLADMGVSPRIVEWLRQQGHDATHLRDQSLERLKDELIFEKAFSEQRILLTFDLGFGEIASLAGTRATSIVVFRLRNTVTRFVIGRLGAVLRDCSEDLNHGAIVLVEDAHHRVRSLPMRRRS